MIKVLLPTAELMVTMMVNYLLCATLLSLLQLIAGVPIIPGEGGVVTSPPDSVSQQSKPSSSVPPPAEADLTYNNDDYDYEEDIIDEGIAIAIHTNTNFMVEIDMYSYCVMIC